MMNKQVFTFNGYNIKVSGKTAVLIFSLVFFLLCSNVFAQSFDAQENYLSYYGDESNYILIERSDLRRYDNGRYTGVTCREVRSFVKPCEPPSSGFPTEALKDRWFEGSFLVLEETKTSISKSAKELSGKKPALFHISPSGKLTVVPQISPDRKKMLDTGFPSYRSFPTYPAGSVKPGDSWQAEAVRSVDPLNRGTYTKLKVVVQYNYIGKEIYKDVPVYHLTAKWATRYGKNTLYYDYDGDETLTAATGTHNADIMVSVETGAAILIKDYLDETFTYADGNSVQFKGTTLSFTEFPPAVDRMKLLPALNRIAKVPPELIKKAEQQDKADGAADASVSGSASTAGVASSTGSSSASGSDGLALGGGSGGSAFGGNSSPDGASGVGGASSGASGKSSVKAALEAGGIAVNPKASETSVSGANLSSPVNAGPSASSAAADPAPMVVEETSEGIRLSVRDLKFAPDSAELLPGERGRLDEIAAVLKLAGKSQFLVEGHSASTGNPRGEMRLSVERAKKVVDELSRRGIPAEQFIFAGYGSERPIADNSTPQGKALNRRVEITILE